MGYSDTFKPPVKHISSQPHKQPPVFWMLELFEAREQTYRLLVIPVNKPYAITSVY